MRCAIALACVIAAGSLAGCRDAPATSSPPASAGAPAIAPSGDGEAAGVRFIERVVGGAPGERLPMIVAIHGLGDHPASFVEVFDGFAGKARIIVPYGLDPRKDGFSWFPIPQSFDYGVMAVGVARAAERVAAMITAITRARPTRGLPIVTGFSQGGMISYELAVHHSATIGAAFPVGGLLPPARWPSGPRSGPFPPIQAFHGDADPVVPIEIDRDTRAHLVEAGFRADLREYPGVRHAMPGDVRRDLLAALDAAARAAGP